AQQVENAVATITTAKPAGPNWRDDDKCGSNSELPPGPGVVGCNPDGKNPCCGPSGWCGSSPQHCDCEGCRDSRRSQGGSPEERLAPGYSVTTPKRIALVVPFRDRGAHLERFRERIQSHIESWRSKNIEHEWRVFVVEQFDNQLFNRGYLFNVGFRYATEYEQQSGKKFDCVVMHDIDILPLPVVDYGWCAVPNQLSGEIECWSWSVPYADNVGGV
ncbi:unnamed protein product, partial [Polarella glacialis]